MESENSPALHIQVSHSTSSSARTENGSTSLYGLAYISSAHQLCNSSGELTKTIVVDAQMFLGNTAEIFVLALCFFNANNIVFGDEPEMFIIQANTCHLLYLAAIVLLIINSSRSRKCIRKMKMFF